MEAPDTITAPPAALATGPRFGKVVVLLALAGLFAYYNSLHGAYVLDDTIFLSDLNVGRPFASKLATRPVVAASVALNYHLDGLNPRGYHLFNLGVHFLAALTVYDLLRRVLLLPRFASRYSGREGWLALAAATIWLVHPLNTQAVTYVVQRCESMMGLFFLVAVWCFLRGATAVSRSAWWYAGGAVAALLGAGCKEVMIALPPVLILFDRALLAGSWGGVLRRWKAHLVVSSAPILWTAWFIAQGYLTGKEGTVGLTVGLFTPYTYALTQCEVILYYLQLSFWPRGQCLDYLDWPVRGSISEAWPWVVGLGVLVAATTYGVLRRRAWGVAAGWFFLILAPTSSVMPLQDAAFEHRMYLSLIGVVVLVVFGVAEVVRWVESRWPATGRTSVRIAGTLAVGVVFTLGFVTVVRNEDYGSALTLYADNAAKRPENSRVRATYALMLFQTGKLAQAETEMRGALASPRQIPGNVLVYVQILHESGRVNEALSVCKQFHARSPQNAPVNRELGILLLATGRPDQAVPYLRGAADGDLTDGPARLHLAIALAESGDEATAVENFEIVRRDFPSLVKALVPLARRTAVDPAASETKKRLALYYARAGLRLAGEADPEAVDTLAVALARVARYPEAAEAADRAAIVAERVGWDAYRVSLIRSRADLFRAGKPFLPASFTN